MNVGIVGIILSGISIIVYLIAKNNNNSDEFVLNVAFGAILLLSGIIAWIKKQITAHYKQMLKDDAIADLEDNLEKEKVKNEKAMKEIERLAKINHKYSTRIDAMENYVKGLSNKMNYEISDEINVVEGLISTLSNDYKKELSDNINISKNIQKTKIVEIDSIIMYFNNKIHKENIEFIVEVKCEIKDLVENIIDESKLETLLGDHIKDAIIAVNLSNNTYRSIKIIFDKKDEIYEISIYDSGIEFKIDTLVKLGIEQVTTHTKTGGSGIGFMTTFETLRNTKASLIIEEYEKSKNSYTKLVNVRFDGKKKYKIN